MVVKFLSKYILEVIPSIVATVVGAYIVTHYINAKPDADKAKTEASAPAQKADTVLTKAAKIAPMQSVPAERPAEKSSDTASASTETRRAPVKEKSAKAVPAEKPAETVAKTEDDRDANEIARAAIARLRKSEPVDAPRSEQRIVTYAPPVAAPAQPQVQNPLPPAQPPVQVSAPIVTPAPPLNEVTIPSAPQPVARADDPSRPMPPAEIPLRPLDIRAKPHERTSVADDVVSAAKTMFHSVIPGIN